MLKVELRPEDVCDVSVYIRWDLPDERQRGSLGHEDHPSFAKLRNFLEARGYIECYRQCWNGDIVLKEFEFNGYPLKEGDTFYSAAHWKIKFKY